MKFGLNKNCRPLNTRYVFTVSLNFNPAQRGSGIKKQAQGLFF